MAGVGPERGNLSSSPPARNQREATIRVLIVEDHLLMAESMASVLRGHGVKVIGIAGTGRDAVTLAKRERPNVVLMDIGLPDMDGIDAGRQILDEVPEARLVALTGLDSADVVQEAMLNGFHGYLHKHAPSSELLQAIRVVAEGHAVMPQKTAQRLATGGSAGSNGGDVGASRLTARELDVLSLLVEGADTAQVAERLFLSPNTVRTHIQNILGKLQVHSRLEAASYAVRVGLVKSPHRRQSRQR